MFQYMAAIFGMSVDEVIKLITAFSTGVVAVLGAVGKLIKNLHGGSKRLFFKIRMLEDIVEMMARPGASPELLRLLDEMKMRQRDDADAKDAKAVIEKEKKGAPK